MIGILEGMDSSYLMVPKEGLLINLYLYPRFI